MARKCIVTLWLLSFGVTAKKHHRDGQVGEQTRLERLRTQCPLIHQMDLGQRNGAAMSVLPPNINVIDMKSFVHIRVVNCTTIAAVTILIWDYLITLPNEVALIWPSSWNISKFLFVLNRYLVFLDSTMFIYVLMFGDDEKLLQLSASSLGNVRSITENNLSSHNRTSTGILILRAYAVWGSQFNRLYAVIFCICLGTFAGIFWTSYKYIDGIYSTGVPTLGMKGCTLFFKNRLAWVDVALIAAVEFISTGLMIVKAIQHCRISRSSLMSTIYHDGLLYFAFILATTISNLMVMVFAPLEINELMVVVQRVLHSVLCSRVLLRIRGAYEAQNRHLICDSLPTIVMAQFLEPLNDSLQSSDRLEC
ncbi:hypothetical protein BD410DRAFT_826505 [Rickenella mellea]|uniref:DUF6533 domain-containing protein n=1 Tax=Rickenella mellea TaxID=50990 RepID=A0A4Y7QD84_9AGAM|nr:hypothetical protein BD410DRAFT_826505 [Rickenella mellea]